MILEECLDGRTVASGQNSTGSARGSIDNDVRIILDTWRMEMLAEGMIDVGDTPLHVLGPEHAAINNCVECLHEFWLGLDVVQLSLNPARDFSRVF